MTSGHRRAVKLVLIGDGGTGKTSYIARICREGFHQDYIATLGYEKTEVVVATSSHGELAVTFWDTAGQEKSGPLRDQYYEGADGAILFFDVTSRVTYKNIPQWYRDITRVCPNIPTVLFANKVDVDERKVKTKSITFHQKHESMLLVEGSVKDKINLKGPVEFLLKSILKQDDLSFSATLESSLFALFEGIDIDKEDIPTT